MIIHVYVNTNYHELAINLSQQEVSQKRLEYGTIIY